MLKMSEAWDSECEDMTDDEGDVVEDQVAGSSPHHRHFTEERESGTRDDAPASSQSQRDATVRHDATVQLQRQVLTSARSHHSAVTDAKAVAMIEDQVAASARRDDVLDVEEVGLAGDDEVRPPSLYDSEDESDHEEREFVNRRLAESSQQKVRAADCFHRNTGSMF